MSPSIPTHEIEHYLRTGSTDPCYQAWPGRNLIEKGERAATVLRAALVEEVRQRAAGRRTTRLHAFRRAFESIALSDGAPRDCIRFLLHPSDRDIIDVYFAPEWSALCAAVQKVNVVRRSPISPPQAPGW